MTGKHARRTGAALRTLQMAAFPCPAKPSRRSGDSPLASSHRTGGGAAVTGRAAAKHPHVHRGIGGDQAPNAVGVAGCPIRVLRRPGGQS